MPNSTNNVTLPLLFRQSSSNPRVRWWGNPRAFANASEPRKNAVGAIAANGGAAAGHVLATSSSSHVSILFLEHRRRICAHSRVAWTTKTHRLVRRVPLGLAPATTSLQ
jgi:hypothetical protein